MCIYDAGDKTNRKWIHARMTEVTYIHHTHPAAQNLAAVAFYNYVFYVFIFTQ